MGAGDELEDDGELEDVVRGARSPRPAAVAGAYDPTGKLSKNQLSWS
jgi:hypothetical protein